jgi:hypothetical protein
MAQIPCENCPIRKKAEAKPKFVAGAPVALAHHLVPRLEGVSDDSFRGEIVGFRRPAQEVLSACP